MNNKSKELSRAQAKLRMAKFWEFISRYAIKVANHAVKHQKLNLELAQAAYNSHLFRNCTEEQRKQVTKMMEEA